MTNKETNSEQRDERESTREAEAGRGETSRQWTVRSALNRRETREGDFPHTFLHADTHIHTTQTTHTTHTAHNTIYTTTTRTHVHKHTQHTQQ
jgi:hypothetical protein